MIFKFMCSKLLDNVSLRLYSMYVSVNIHVCVLDTVPGRSTAELRVFRSKRKEKIQKYKYKYRFAGPDVRQVANRLAMKLIILRQVVY